MVQTTTSQTTSATIHMQGAITLPGVDSTNETVVENSSKHLEALSKANYTLVAIDIDTTGRRLIDEIINLGAYTSKDRFGQFIMPYMNLNPAARQRHQIRVISIGFYRMLKSTLTSKIIKSKSEIAALKNFLDWLEAVKSKDANSQGIILVYYEERKFIPYMVLESLKKYNLLDRFLNTVKSFVNCLHLAKTNIDEALENYTLRKISKHLKGNLNSKTEKSTTSGTGNSPPTTTTGKEQSREKKDVKKRGRGRESFDGSATVRARLTFEVAVHLSNKNTKASKHSKNSTDKMLVALQPYTQPIEYDLKELQTQNKNLERQNSFRPVFLNYFKTTLYHRMRAVKFRIILAEHGYDLETLSVIWSEKKRDGLVEILEGMGELKSEQKTELADLFDSHLDPDKSTIKPVVGKIRNRNRNRRVRHILRQGNRNTEKEQGASGDKQQAETISPPRPDSTTISPKNQSVKRHLHDNKTFSKTQLNKVTDSDSANQMDKTTVTSGTPTVSN